MNFDYFPLVVFAGVAIFMIVRVVRYGGIKGALFGARIERTVGEIKCSSARLITPTVKVHKLEAEDDKAVGLELVYTSFASYQMTPVTMTKEEVGELVKLLNKAIGVG